MLREVARDKNLEDLRADALLGLAHSASSPETRQLLLRQVEKHELAGDALRSLREVAGQEEVEKAIVQMWNKGDMQKKEIREPGLRNTPGHPWQ